MNISCSVVSGTDRGAIVLFLKSFSLSADHTRRSCPNVNIFVTAIVNSNDRELGQQVASLCDEVVIRSTPLGFAANHNDVMSQLTSDFHIVANDDVLVEEQTLSTLLKTIQKPGYENVAVLSPLLRNGDGSLQPSTYSFPTVPTVLLAWSGLRHVLPPTLLRRAAMIARPRAGASRLWGHDREIDVQTLRGAFVLVRMAAIASVGPMTEVALVGGEETEWHARMRNSGWRVVFTPSAEVTHFGRVTTGGRADLEVEYLKGTLNYFAQHRSLCAYYLVRFAAQRKSAQIARRYWRDTGHSIPLYGIGLRQIAHKNAASKRGITL